MHFWLFVVTRHSMTTMNHTILERDSPLMLCESQLNLHKTWNCNAWKRNFNWLLKNIEIIVWTFSSSQVHWFCADVTLRDSNHPSIKFSCKDSALFLSHRRRWLIGIFDIMRRFAFNGSFHVSLEIRVDLTTWKLELSREFREMRKCCATSTSPSVTICFWSQSD